MRSFLILVIGLYGGCSVQKSVESYPIHLFSCEDKAKPKSLQFLEQQYRCTNYLQEGE